MKTVETPAIIALHLPSSHLPNFISATKRYVVVATTDSIISFQLNPAQAVAYWKAPSHYSITALKLSPDSEALAAVIHRPEDSALVMLHPHSLSRLFRIALPPFTANPSISFVSPPSPSTSLTSSLLPAHLETVFAQVDRPKSASPLPSTPTAQFALALSPTCPSKSPIIVVFHKRYMRLHHLTTLPQPRPLTLLSVPSLSPPSPELVLFDKQSIHLLSPKGHHQINSAFPIHIVLASVHSPSFAIAAIVEHPTDRTCVAVFRGTSITLTPITNPLPNVALIPTSDENQFLLGSVTVTGVVLIADLFLRPYVIIDVVPRPNVHVSTTSDQVNLCIPPTPFSPLSVVVNNDIVMCRYSAQEQLTVT